jgi:hypothetical protein
MLRGATWAAAISGLFVFALGGVGSAVAADDFKYVGASKCKSCHKKELIGNQYGAWAEAKHSKAFETLKSEDAAKIAKEKGLTVPAHEADECVKCHATAFGLTEAQVAKKPLKVSDGVQCESCHGPGSKYRKKKTMSDHDKSVAAGRTRRSAPSATTTRARRGTPRRGSTTRSARRRSPTPFPRT